jgi:hypothetical protein
MTDQEREEARKEAEIKAKQRARMIQAAQVYARADRTDPFSMMRMMTHIDNGVASIHAPANRDYDIAAGPGFYNAEMHREARKIVGSDGKEQTFDVPVYRNVSRP